MPGAKRLWWWVLPVLSVAVVGAALSLGLEADTFRVPAIVLALLAPAAAIVGSLATARRLRMAAERELAQVRLEAERRARELEVLMDAVPVGMMITRDSQGMQISGNRATHELLRVPLREPNISKSAPDPERVRTYRPVRNGVDVPPEGLPIQRAARGEEVQNWDCDLVFDDGEVRHVIVNATPLRDEDGAPRGAIAAFLDITDRTRAEQALRESEARASALVKYAPTGIYEIDYREPRFLSVNDAMCRILGYSREELLSIGPAALLDEDSRRLFADRIRRLTAGQAIDESVEYRVRRKDGTLMHAVLNVSLNLRKDRALVIAHDITERMRAEEALRQSEERFRRLAEAAFEGLLVHREGIISDVNASLLDMLGYQRHELVGRSALRFVDPACRGLVRQRLRTPYEIEVVHRCGTRIPVELMAKPFADPDRVVVSVRDLRQRKQSEARLVLQAHLLTSITDVVYSTDAQLRLTSWNRAAEKAYGWTEVEVLGKNVLEVTRSRFDPDARSHMAAMLRASGSATAETEHTTRSGERVIFESRVMQLHDASGVLTGYVAVSRDVTDRKRAEAALRESDRQLRAARDDLERRVLERTAELERRTQQLRSLTLELTQAEGRERKRLSTLIHDHLQQLLVGAKLSVEVAQRSAEQEPASKALQESILNVGELLDESIRVSRSLMVELSPPILHEAGLAAGLKWLARWMEEKHGLGVRVRADGDVPPDATGVSDLVFQCVRELLFNVSKHAGVAEAQVELRTVDGSRLEVVVADRGAGFDVVRAEARGSDGGFGLFSIRERIDLLGGRVAIESAPGGGTRVTLTAPLPPRVDSGAAGARAGSASAGPGAARGEPARGSRIRIVLADDHRIVREGLVMLIRDEADMEVVGEAADGAEAVEMACRLRPDVVIMDVSMPKVNGIEATARIAAGVPGARVIGLSMYERADREEAMRAAGAVAYLRKDGPSENLIAAIRAASGR